MPRRWARGWPRAPGRDGTASGGENPGLVAEQHLPDFLRTAADSSPPRMSADRSTLPRVLARSPIVASIPPLPATLSRPRDAVCPSSLSLHTSVRNSVAFNSSSSTCGITPDPTNICLFRVYFDVVITVRRFCRDKKSTLDIFYGWTDFSCFRVLRMPDDKSDAVRSVACECPRLLRVSVMCGL